MNKKIVLIVLLVFGFISIAKSEESIIIKSAKTELNRFMEGMKSQKYPPYFIAYGISDVKSTTISASFGKIINNSTTKKRVLDIDLRVGDYQLDNTHIIRGQAFSFGFRGGSIALPIENDELALRNAMWYASEKKYKDAVERYQKVLTNKEVKVKEEDSSADFSHETPNKYFGKIITLQFDKQKWENIIRNVSAVFANYSWLYSGYVTLKVENTTKYLVSSEGSEIQMSEPYVRVFISAKTKSNDGMSLPLYRSFFAFEPKNLPKEKTLIDAAEGLVKILDNMRIAPLMSTYSGPAILSGEAAGVFFHEIFGHRTEGHRIKDPKNAQTFKGFLNKEILPKFLNVVFDPTLKEIRGKKLSGYYKYDDEGVKARKVDIVDHGIFKSFLMSRIPIDGFSHSNGHGRRQAGYKAVSRQSNLIVKSDKTMPLDELKNKLREECKKQEKEFGLYFVKVQGGFTFTGRSIPNSFNVNPLLVYKVFVDGRPDELVRGVDLIGTPLTTFSNIEAAADDLGVFNGICGAESGGVPVSASSPSLLVSKIEVQKKSKSQAKLPILPSPDKKINP